MSMRDITALKILDSSFEISDLKVSVVKNFQYLPKGRD